LPLEEALLPAGERPGDLVALDEALEELKAIDPRRYRIVTFWFFVGLTQEEIARELSISINTVGRQWQAARLWLQHRLRPDGATG
jgi:RNA polymerase sigma factor (sigma-70 family)